MVCRNNPDTRVRTLRADEIDCRQKVFIAARCRKIRLSDSRCALQSVGVCQASGVAISAQEDRWARKQPLIEIASGRAAVDAEEADSEVARRTREPAVDIRRSVIFPSDSEVERQVSRDLPVILGKAGHLVDDDLAVEIRPRQNALPLSVLNILVRLDPIPLLHSIKGSRE